MQQSQDDGWDQVVWRVSPTAERLQGCSVVEHAHQIKFEAPVLQSNKNACNLPNVHGILTRASTGHPAKAAAPPGKKRSPSLAGKLERWLSTSELDSVGPKSTSSSKPSSRSTDGAAIFSDLKKVSDSTEVHEVPNQHQPASSASNDKENEEAVLFGGSRTVSSVLKLSQNQPHHQPTSSALRCCSLVLKTQKKKGSSKQTRSGQRRKALLELLDRVQNVISVPEPTSRLAEFFSAHSNGLQAPKVISEISDPAPDGEVLSEGRDTIEAALGHGGVEATSIVNVEQNPCSLVQGEISSTDNISERELCQAEREASSHALERPEEKLWVSNNKSLQSTTLTVNDTDSDSQHLDSYQQISSECHEPVPETLASIHFLVLEVADLADEGSETRSSPRKVLRLLNEQSGDERVLYLQDEWFFTVVRPGDTVNVIGEFDVDGKCTIDRKNNLLVVHPDLLISGSRVGASFSCPRRAVLDERIRSSDVAFAALLGTMMHQLFQVGLARNISSKVVLEHEAETIVQQHIDSLYACRGNEREALGKLKDCIPTILNWLDCFLRSSAKSSALPKVDFGRNGGQLPISISEVIDIEEMIYSPKFGLKGMIDASLGVQFSRMNLGAENHIMPLEFKTGKATTGQAALEHRAQVILYSLLMSDRYMQNIDGGLLYYLYTSQTQGVAIQHADLVGLIMRRNDHATNLLAASSAQLLPPMLQSMHMCQGCWHLDACSIYHKAQEGGTTESSGLGELFNERTEHLGGIHFEFLKLWDRLIDLEAQDLQASQKEIWRLPSRQREEAGRCLSSMRIDFSTEHLLNEQNKSSGLVYRFCRDITFWNQSHCIKKEKETVQTGGLHERPFSCGDRVLLSTESGHIAVAGGVILDISESSILISFSHQLRLPGKPGVSDKEQLLHELWRIDKDEAASFLANMRFNLLQLFFKTNGHEHGRQLIVDLKPPKFDIGGLFSQDPATLYVRSAPGLNDDQRRAIFKILSARDYALILGMPGTGKTSTIVHAVRALLTRGASILLTSYTNSAVDNILLKLKSQGVDFVRLGRAGAIHSELKQHAIAGLGITSVKELELRMSSVHVVGATCLGVTHPLLTNRKFDVCIVDEAGQITLPVCLGPLRFANTFVLVGDHYQLPPLVRNPEAREKGLAVSLFRRLSEAHPQSISALQCQYRMCAGIMGLCNALIYGNRLRCGSPEVANARLEIIGDLSCQPFWLRKVTDTAQSVLFLNTDLLSAYETRIRSAIYNVTEATIVLKVIKTFVEGGLDAQDIGVISPYNYQVEHIRRLLAAEGLPTLEVHTIDKYQGRDKDCVLVSFVKSTNQGRSSGTLLADWHRINVAITRAKKKLILIGSQKTLSATPVLNLLIKQVELGGGMLHLSQEAGLSVSGLRRCNALNSVSKE